jgi:hypothetical protein
MDQDTFLVGNGDGASFHAPVKKLAFIATHPPDLQQFDGSPARRHPVQDHKSCGRIIEYTGRDTFGMINKSCASSCCPA